LLLRRIETAKEEEKRVRASTPADPAGVDAKPEVLYTFYLKPV
jgi:hypothetical protein